MVQFTSCNDGLKECAHTVCHVDHIEMVLYSTAHMFHNRTDACMQKVFVLGTVPKKFINSMF